MNRPLNRRIVASLYRFGGSTVQRFTILFCALIFPLACLRAISIPAETGSARSVSGQFIVTGAAQVSPLAASAAVATNADFVRLEPAAAGRFRRAHQGIAPARTRNQRGRAVARTNLSRAASRRNRWTRTSPSFPRHSPTVGITASNCPTSCPARRFMRALTGVLLLEFADRNAGAHSAEIPDVAHRRLVAAIARHRFVGNHFVVAGQNRERSAASRRSMSTERGFDLLAGARRVLQNQPALTFEQLSWPADAQLSGADGGAYRASAQLFVHELLDLKNGAAKLRAMLENLPQVYNWQTAFQTAFRENFPAAARRGKMVGAAASSVLPRATPARNGRPPPAATSSTGF